MPRNHSTKGKHSAKPGKPREDFPLFDHSNGLWCKKIRGKLCYFGPWSSDPKGEAALAKYLDQKDDLYAGRVPRSKTGLMTVEDLADLFCAWKEHQANTGDITRGVWAAYLRACRRMIDVFGPRCPVVSLQPVDFERLVAAMAKTLGPMARKTEMQRCRTVLKYAYDQQYIPAPIRTGQAFQAPSLRAIKRQQNGNGGRKVFEAAELRKLIRKADKPLRAMILLGINCGFGNNDCASLPQALVDLDAGWHSFPRPKTGCERRGKLWPETVSAIREAIAVRPNPKDPADKDMVFLTPRGNRFVRPSKNGWSDAIGSQFAKLLKATGLDRPGLSFYSLRHSHETVAGGCKDQVAVNLSMGHTDPTMAANYRHGIDDARLVAVADTVHAWLFPPKKQQ